VTARRDLIREAVAKHTAWSVDEVADAVDAALDPDPDAIIARLEADGWLTAFFVPGIPAPQGSKRAFVVKGRPVLTESAGEKHKAWRLSVLYAARETGVALRAPVYVRLRFVLPRPASVKKRPWPSVRPDLDKLIRSTLDGLVDAGLIDDDAHVCTLTASKQYGDRPGCGVQVLPMTELEDGAA
jgi:Holliday junction resolvase RusA-like endonuclease